MSAHIVDENVIEFLVAATQSRNISPFGFSYYWNGRHNSVSSTDEQIAIGQILVDENYRSVNYRYSENDTPDTFAALSHYTVIDPLVVLSVIGNYSYQSCETSDWRESEAYAIIESLKGDCVRRLTEDLSWNGPKPYSRREIS